MKAVHVRDTERHPGGRTPYLMRPDQTLRVGVVQTLLDALGVLGADLVVAKSLVRR